MTRRQQRALHLHAIIKGRKIVCRKLLRQRILLKNFISDSIEIGKNVPKKKRKFFLLLKTSSISKNNFSKKAENKKAKQEAEKQKSGDEITIVILDIHSAENLNWAVVINCTTAV